MRGPTLLVPTLAFIPLVAALLAGAGEGRPLLQQTTADADAKSEGCLSCHRGIEPMHRSPRVRLGCTDCHGGDATAKAPDPDAKRKAHVAPRDPSAWAGSANPVRSYTLLNRERREFVRFANPGDLRVVDDTCGTSSCHEDTVRRVRTSMMTTGPMLWGAALYNNGVVPFKDPRFGEAYSPDGKPLRLVASPEPAPEETLARGVLPLLEPLPRFNVGQPGNLLRVFERGGRRPLEIAIPDPTETPGRPARRLSERGLGTATRTDPVLLGLQKTRLLDPMLSFLGTNDHPGDFRSSGCTACHVVYANDRDPAHSGPFGAHGNRGATATADATIPRGEPGHPIRHELTVSIPSSQCMVCHIHPGTNVVNAYFGTMWWDNESDGEHMYPAEPVRLSPEREREIRDANPEGAALRGLWSSEGFLANLVDRNPALTHNRFADFHGHGWVFRNVYRRDRAGNLLDRDGSPVPSDAPDRFGRAVHLEDVHQEKGMHCVDCHFERDVHGDGNLYGETRAATEIECVDCHGSIRHSASLVSSGNAGGRDLSRARTPWGRPRFEWSGGRLLQRSMIEEDRAWEVVQVVDTITPGNPHYSEASRFAKTVRRDGSTWGNVPGDPRELAHGDESLACYTCHSSWTTSCFGCHLSMEANQRTDTLHAEGESTRNWTSYNFQTLRDDVFLLGRDGTVKGNRIVPVRSACAVLVSSRTANREWVYAQQQTVSAEGYSGQAFSPHFPHTVRGRETKGCADCHLSSSGDNNAWMAQVLMQGTGFTNWMGRSIYVAEGKSGFDAVTVTESDEPQAVLGSTLHRIAYPDRYRAHERRGGMLEESIHHDAEDARSIQLRGEYVYVAEGARGLVVYDVANVDHKGFSEKIVTAPASPIGQRLYVPTADATAVAAPTTLAVDPTRSQRPENQERPIHPLYGYLYVSDRTEGLVVVGAATLLDGDPANNFLERALAFNPDEVLSGATGLAIAGERAYLVGSRGLAIVSIADPLRPEVLSLLGPEVLRAPRQIAIQLRYAFVVDADGLQVIDVTAPRAPRKVATVPIAGARGIYVARTYAYVAAGSAGLVIVDVERPASPRIDQIFDAGGRIDDAWDVKVGMTNASLFAYLADGRNGLRVIQLTSPETTPGYLGFSPRPRPSLVATFPGRGPAVAVSRGIDRDRAVDESGNQIAVFGRRGARPLDASELSTMLFRDGKPWTVEGSPAGPPLPLSSRRPEAEGSHPEPPDGDPYSSPKRR